MSHGNENGIVGIDDKSVSIAEISDKLSGRKCRALVGKPKMMFVQACRGGKYYVEEKKMNSDDFSKSEKPVQILLEFSKTSK